MKASEITLRDYFAGLAMQTIMEDALRRFETDGSNLETVPMIAYGMAEQMIDERIDRDIDREEEEKKEFYPPRKIGEYWPEQGGLYFGRIEENGEIHALIVARKHEGERTQVNWHEANQFCQSCIMIGEFYDWEMPNRYDLMTIFRNNNENIGDFSNDWYWSSTNFAAATACVQFFDNGDQSNYFKIGAGSVRAVRKVCVS